MPVKINASVSSGLVVDSDLTGSLQLQTGGNPAISIDSSQVVNFTKQFQIGGVLPPAFGAFGSTGTSLINNTDTKIVYDTEEFDTNNNFASSRFTPTFAGYYQLNAVALLNVSSGVLGIMLFKNGSRFKYGTQTLNTTSYAGSAVSTLVYANGTTDYFEIFAIQSGGTATHLGGQAFNYFNGYFVRE